MSCLPTNTCSGLKIRLFFSCSSQCASQPTTRAIAKIEDWVYREGPLLLAGTARTFFPDVPLDLLTRSLQRYWDAGLWARHPAMSRAGFDRLGQSFHSGGVLSRLPKFEDCVDANLGSGAED